MTVFKPLTLHGLRLKEIPFQREFELQGYVIAHPELLSLVENDDQFDVEELIGVERRLKKGRIDLAVEYKSGQIAIVELKRGNLTKKDFDQLKKYLDEVASSRNLNALKEDDLGYDDIDERLNKNKVFGVLVGRTVDKTVLESLKTSRPTVNVLLIRRYNSDDNEFLTTEVIAGFHAKDYRKYRVDGNGPFGKGRMVLAVIKSYISRHEDVSYQSIMTSFPPELRGTKGKWGCVSLFEEAKKLAERTRRKRHFLDEEDVITLKDGARVAVSSQWGIGNIEEFIKRATDLHVKVEEVKV